MLCTNSRQNTNRLIVYPLLRQHVGVWLLCIKTYYKLYIKCARTNYTLLCILCILCILYILHRTISIFQPLPSAADKIRERCHKENLYIQCILYNNVYIQCLIMYTYNVFDDIYISFLGAFIYAYHVLNNVLSCINIV